MNSNSTATETSEQAVQLIEHCSYKCNYSESIARGTNVEKLCQAKVDGFGEKHSLENGWILVNNNRQETLTVTFQTSVFVCEIQIYESLNAGSIVKLEAFESRRNKWWTMWEEPLGSITGSVTCRVFQPTLRRYRFKSQTIRVTIDPTYTDRIVIQAIQLIGTNIFDSSFHHITLPEAMTHLYKQVLSNTQLDIQFLVDDKIINVHRNILCCRSSYFYALLLDNFSEKTQERPIKLTDIDYETFLELLYFIYTSVYHEAISYELAMKCMIYSNKINFLAGKSAALNRICYHLRANHDLILPLYACIIQRSSEFDALLDYIYDLCSHHLSEICGQKEFSELGKDEMIDLITQSTQRRDIRDQERRKQIMTR